MGTSLYSTIVIDNVLTASLPLLLIDKLQENSKLSRNAIVLNWSFRIDNSESGDTAKGHNR